MITAFVTGLLGSLHCLGMCGPLAAALPGQGRMNRTQYLLGRLTYNLGRIFTYSILGALVSLVGVAAQMFWLQQYVSVVLGIILIVMAIRGMIKHARKKPSSSPLNRWIIRRYSYFLQNPMPGRLFLLGTLNGLLPCGLVYLGLFQATLAPSLWEGMAIMAMFGLGTLPLMMGISLSGNWIRKNLLGRAKLVLPSLTLILGLMLGVRGMALGIPYLSPKLEWDAEGKAKVGCHIPEHKAATGHSSADTLSLCD